MNLTIRRLQTGKPRRVERSRLLFVVLVGLAILGRGLGADSRVPLVATDNTYSMEMPALSPANPLSVSGNVVTDNGAVPAIPVTARVVGRPGGGTLVLAANGAFTYTPRPGFHGFDSFTYTINNNAIATTSVVALTSTLFDSAGGARAAWLASVQSWLGPVRLTRIFNAATDGRTVDDINAMVQDRGPTLAILRVRDQRDASRPAEVIGGFNPRAWRTCREDEECYQLAMTDAERTAFLFNFTTGIRLDQRLTTNPCSTDVPGDPDCGAFQTQNHPVLAVNFGGPSAYDLLLGCNIDLLDCDSDLGHGQAFAQSYGGRWRTGAYWDTGGHHQSIFVSNWLNNDPGFPDFAGKCLGSCGAFRVDTLNGTPGGPLAIEMYSVTRLGADSNIATVTIHVTGNTPPDAVNDRATVRQGQSVDVAILANDSDVENDPVTVAITTLPTEGTVAINEGGTLTYTPAGLLAGVDQFTYTINDGFDGEDTATVVVDVTPTRLMTVTADNESRIYDAAPFFGFTFTPTVSPSGDCTIAGTPVFGGTAIGAIQAGNGYTITVAGLTSDDCTIAFEPGHMDIGKAPLQVSPRPVSKVYGRTAAPLLGDVTGLRGGDGVSITATFASAGAAAIAPAGSYPITVTSISDAGTGRLANYVYDLTLQPATLTVGRKTLTVTPTAQAKVYGTVAAPTGGISGQENGDVFTATYASPGAAATAATGSYPITVASVAGAAMANYAPDLTTATLTVNQALLKVTPANATKTYGGTGAAFTGVFSGQKNGDVFTATYGSDGAAALAGAGSYPIMVASVAGAALDNYTQDLRIGTLTVNRAVVTITPGASTKTYGQTATLTGTITGQQNGDVLTATYASSGAAVTVGAGSYPITVSGVAGAGAANYTQDLKTGTLTVTRALLTVTPDDTTKIYGQTATLTGAISGQQNGDVLTATYASTGALPAAAVGTGTYPITVAGVAGAKVASYTLALKAATLTVTARAVTVTADAQTKSLSITDPPLTYQITGGSLASGGAFSGVLTRVSGQTVGTYTIQQGSLTLGPNYSLTVVPASLTIMKGRAPVAVADSYSTLKRTRLTIAAPGVLRNDTDADRDVKTAVLVRSVTSAQGTLTLLPGGSFVFTPAKDFAGTATFTYRAVDAAGLASNTVTASIAVTRNGNGSDKDDDDEYDGRHDKGDHSDCRHDRDDDRDERHDNDNDHSGRHDNGDGRDDRDGDRDGRHDGGNDNDGRNDRS